VPPPFVCSARVSTPWFASLYPQACRIPAAIGRVLTAILGSTGRTVGFSAIGGLNWTTVGIELFPIADRNP
jgi:hypothetical protein